MPSLLWERYRQEQDNRAEAVARANQNRADAVRFDMAVFERRLNRLALCNQALWELLRDNTTLTDDDLRAKICEIDARDGREDSQMSAQQIPCAACGKLSNTKRNTCVYCGATLPKPHLFE